MYQSGVAETMLGNAMKSKRDHLVIASKVFFKMGEDADQKGLSRKAIVRAIDESLKRLGTDYLDIYYMHAPDHTVPIDESLEAMATLVKQGKVRYLASSNYASWQVVQMLWIAKERSWNAPHISQPMYNLLARGIEQEYLPMCKEFGVSTVVYNPLAGGLLTGKHKQANVTPGTRFDNNKLYQDRYWHEQYFNAVEQLRKIAQSAGRSLVSLALTGCCITPPAIASFWALLAWSSLTKTWRPRRMDHCLTMWYRLVTKCGRGCGGLCRFTTGDAVVGDGSSSARRRSQQQIPHRLKSVRDDNK
jgi:aryl-alcohol dehydrogenase-like predicted oxidoreductase